MMSVFSARFFSLAVSALFASAAIGSTSATPSRPDSDPRLLALERPEPVALAVNEHAIEPQLASLVGGGYVLAWSARVSGGFELFTQRHDTSGRPIATPSRLRTQGASSLLHTTVAGLIGGGHVLVWTQMDPKGPVVQVQIYGADGSAMGAPRRANASPLGGQVEPEVMSLSDGGFVIGWISTTRQAPRFGVYARRFGADGAPSGPELTVAATDYFMNHRRVSIASLPDAGFVLAWASLGQDGSGYGVFARQYDGRGEAFADQQNVNTTWLGDQFHPAVTGLSDGSYVIAWTQSGLAPSIQAQRFSPQGARAGNEQRVDQPPTGASGSDARAASTLPASTPTNPALPASAAPISPAIAPLPGGGYVISWSALDLAGDTVLARRFGRGGEPMGAALRMRSPARSAQRWSAIATLDNGQLVLAWSSSSKANAGRADWRLHTQRLRAGGRALASTNKPAT
jgi:hypothetical protein